MLERIACEEVRTSAAIGLTHNAPVILGSSPKMIQTQVECNAQMRDMSTEAAKQRLIYALVGP
jgi:hypothetical protein